MTTETEAPMFTEWAIVELMGHRRLAGLVREQQIAGHGFLRLDVPDVTEEPGDKVMATQFYSPSSVYCITPTTEAIARKLAADNKPQPATRWELEERPALERRIAPADFDDDDDEYEGS